MVWFSKLKHVIGPGGIPIGFVPVWVRVPVQRGHPNVQDLGVSTRDCQSDVRREEMRDQSFKNNGANIQESTVLVHVLKWLEKV